MLCPDYVAQEQIVFRPGPHRFEAGTANLLGLLGMNAALELLLEIGVENIAAELLRKRTWLVPALEGRGWRVLNAKAGPESASAIISISRPDRNDLPPCTGNWRKRAFHLLAHRTGGGGNTSGCHRISTIPTRNCSGWWKCCDFRGSAMGK